MKTSWHRSAGVAGLVLACVSTWSVVYVSGQSGQPARQAPQAQAAAKPQGTGRISVQVVALDSGAPVKRVAVSLMGGTPLQWSGRGGGPGSAVTMDLQIQARGGSGLPAGMVQKMRETDASGGFEFTGLPAGRYTINVVSGGPYMRSPSESVQLSDGGSATVTFRLERTGAITGKIFDETGDPMPRAQIRASRWDSSGGVRRLVSAGMGQNTSNDLGEYRLWDLPPGDYFVSASYTSAMGPAILQDVDEPRLGYAPTYYPGTPAMDSALRITVRSGQDSPGIDIPLQRAKMGRVIVAVVDSMGSPMSNRGFVQLTPRSDAAQGGVGMARRPDGTFMSGEVPPGDYYLFGNQSSPDAGPNSPGTSEGAIVPISVMGDEIAVTLQLNRGATIKGHVTVEGKMPDPMPVGRGGGSGAAGATGQARVTVSARTGSSPTQSYMPGTSTGRPAPMAEDGSFELTGVRGFVRLTASGLRGVLKSVTKGTQDILTNPLELTGTERITDVEVVFTTDTGSIDGTVTDSRGEPASGAMVLVFSEDASRWFEGSPYVRQLRSVTAAAASSAAQRAPAPGSMPSGMNNPREPGSIMSASMVPGRYAIVAFEPTANQAMPAYDPEALEKLRSKATSVTVTAGQTATVQLKTIKQ
jgi:protocatechuate 3,4-dioxygenase beta subunit